MTVLNQSAADDQLGAGDESGTAPGDRAFRADIQGLRGIAILTVVLFHAGFPGTPGGYIGVDVFFVISGFVITGVLLRERTASASTSFVSFYARRARRIIPAATLVILPVVILSYVYLGSTIGHQNAVDGFWAAVFLANFHFTATATNYFAAHGSASLLLNYWSLSVEEQFYLVYPAIFVVVASAFLRRWSLRVRLGIVLAIAVAASYIWCVIQTSNNPAVAYFSPFTRAWELALGGLISVLTGVFSRLPRSWAVLLSWCGLAGIAIGAFAFTSTTTYPGALVAIPVAGTALVIAGGCANPRWGAERLLAVPPLLWLGLVSYSLYLWHWPVLEFATQLNGGSLTLWESLGLVVLALGLSAATYYLYENRVRHSLLLRKKPAFSVAMGAALILLTVTTIGIVVWSQPSPPGNAFPDVRPAQPCVAPSRQTVRSLAATAVREPNFLPPANALTPIRVLVVGDSTACTLLPGIEAVGSLYGATFENGAVIGCGVVSNQLAPFIIGNLDYSYDSRFCQKSVATTESTALRQGPPNLVLWASTWESGELQVNGATGPVGLEPGTRGWRSVLLQRMDQRLKKLTADGGKVVMLEEPPPLDPAGTTRLTARDRAALSLISLDREFASKHPSTVRLLDLAGLVCPNGPPCPAIVAGQLLRPDGYHYSPTTSLFVAKWLVPRLLAPQ